MMKNSLIRVVAFSLVALVGTLGFASASESRVVNASDSVRYIDDMKLVRETLLVNVGAMISKNPNWGITQLKSGFDTLALERQVSLLLPKKNADYMSADVMYEQRSSGVLMVGRYYDCGNCPNMHAAVTATAAVLTEDGICVTNDHVMAGLLEAGSSSDLDSVAFVGTIDGKVYPIIEVLSYSKIGDISIIRVDTRGDKLTPIPLGNGLRPGSAVRAITHPSGNYYYYSEGVVARNTVNSRRGGMSKRMEITADYAVGSSGGPIFDEAGNLVGLVSTTSSLVAGGRGERTQHQMTIKQTVPVELIKQLLAQ